MAKNILKKSTRSFSLNSFLTFIIFYLFTTFFQIKAKSLYALNLLKRLEFRGKSYIVYNINQLVAVSFPDEFSPTVSANVEILCFLS